MAVYPLLALLWALVLVPPMLRRRVHNRAEFAEFDRMRLCFVGSTKAPSHHRGEVTPTPVRRSATQRRRRVLALIGAGLVATLVAALIMRTKLAWGMHLMIYDILIAYVALLARASDRIGRRSVVAAAAPIERPRAVAPVRRIRPTALPERSPLPALLQAASR